MPVSLLRVSPARSTSARAACPPRLSGGVFFAPTAATPWQPVVKAPRCIESGEAPA